MRRLLIALVLMLAACGPQMTDRLYGEQDSNIVRAYHLDRSGHGSSNLCDTSIGCPTLGIWFQQAVAATYTPEIGAAYVMTVNGNPTRVAAGTWPAGFSAAPGYSWRLDGTGDYLSLADAGGAFSSQGAWSVSCAVIPRYGFAANDVLAAKWNTTGDKRSWRLYTGGTSAVLDISSDGAAGTITTLTKASALAINRLSWITASCDGAGNCSLWVDGLSVATSAAMGDPYEGSAAFTLGADAEAAGDGPVEFYRCVYQDAALTSADHLRAWRRFRGMFDGSASNAVTYSAATPPALQVADLDDGVMPLLVEMPVNSGMIGKTATCAGVYGASAVTNLVQRSTFETWALGAATGWVETPTDTGDATQSTTVFAHGSSAMLLSTADADDAITVKGACLTVADNPALVYSFSWFDWLASGTGALNVSIYEDDTADCSSPTGHSLFGVVPHLGEWSHRVTPFSTQAGTIRVQVWIELPAAAAQETVVDAVQLRLGGATDAYCGADTDASAVCTTSIPSHPSALSANGSQTVEATFCTPFAAADLAAASYLWHDYSAAANQIMLRLLNTTDEPTWRVYDGATAYLEQSPSTATNWAANTPYTLRAYMSGLGGLGITWPIGTWFTATGGAGTGIRSAAMTTTYLCGSNTAGADCWITGETTYRGWLR